MRIESYQVLLISLKLATLKNSEMVVNRSHLEALFTQQMFLLEARSINQGCSSLQSMWALLLSLFNVWTAWEQICLIQHNQIHSQMKILLRSMNTVKNPTTPLRQVLIQSVSLMTLWQILKTYTVLTICLLIWLPIPMAWFLMLMECSVLVIGAKKVLNSEDNLYLSIFAMLLQTKDLSPTMFSLLTMTCLMITHMWILVSMILQPFGKMIQLSCAFKTRFLLIIGN